MRRLAIALTALAALAGLTAAPVVAQTKMDCSRLSKDFWEKFDRCTPWSRWPRIACRKSTHPCRSVRA